MGPSGTDTLRLLAAASPVLVIAVLVIFLNMSALGLSLWGLLLTSVIAGTLFHTSVTTILLGALDGVITTLPLLLIVFFGIMLSVLLIRTGALPRVVNGLSGRFRHPMHQVSAICFGIENFVAGAGIIAEPIIAPTLKAVGLPAKSAAILAIWGYAGIMSFSLAGAFLLILSLVTGLDLHELAITAAVISLVPTLMCGILLPLVVGKRELAKGHILFNACVGLACASPRPRLRGLYVVFGRRHARRHRSACGDPFPVPGSPGLENLQARRSGPIPHPHRVPDGSQHVPSPSLSGRPETCILRIGSSGPRGDDQTTHGCVYVSGCRHCGLSLGLQDRTQGILRNRRGLRRIAP